MDSPFAWSRIRLDVQYANAGQRRYHGGFEAEAMNAETFLSHHGLTENPFAAEEARHDPVFQRLSDGQTSHPEFDKILGRLDEPSTSIQRLCCVHLLGYVVSDPRSLRVWSST